MGKGLDYITLGNSNLRVSQLGFGCDPMGGHCWGNVHSQDAVLAIKLALNRGVTLFDTADVYGLGRSESLLGQALTRSRQDVVVATKFGVRFDNYGRTYYDNSPQWIEQALTESLKRLNTEYIDLYQIHYLDGITPLENVVEVLERKRDEGKIRYFGFSNITFDDLVVLNTFGPLGGLISFQNEYSLANRSGEGQIRAIAGRFKLGLLTWGSLGQGVLSGKYDSNSTFDENDRRLRLTYVNFHGEKFINNLKIVKKMKEISAKYNKPLTAIALRWILDYLGEGVVLTGIKNSSQLLNNLDAFGWYLSKEDVCELDSISL